MKRIVYLPGDGIGPEVIAATQRIIEAVAAKVGMRLDTREALFGGAAIDETGSALPPETETACLTADAVMLGAIGGPKWDMSGPRPESGLLALRKRLGVYANIRPTRVFPGLEALSPLKNQVAAGVDFMIVRELTGGLYFGERVEGDAQASDLCVYSADEVKRVARVAFALARERRGRVTSVDKANVLATSRLWRRTVTSLHAEEFPEVRLDHVLVDAMAMKLIQHPASFDVILTENLFGDILSDEASVIAGSIGLAGSASIGGAGRGLFEPIHGSAPDIAGRGIANPSGAFLSAAMMFRMSLGSEPAARAIEAAVEETIRAGGRTADLGGALGVAAFTDAVLQRFA